MVRMDLIVNQILGASILKSLQKDLKSHQIKKTEGFWIFQSPNQIFNSYEINISYLGKTYKNLI